jgi:hypothetical protein
MNKQDKEKKTKKFALTDIPTMVFAGATLGFLASGVLVGTVGLISESADHKAWQWSMIWEGIIYIGIGAAINAIAALYWWLVPRKSGVLKPALNGFGILLGVLAFLSAGIVAIKLTSFL